MAMLNNQILALNLRVDDEFCQQIGFFFFKILVDAKDQSNGQFINSGMLSFWGHVPSGKQPYNYGNSPFLMGKSTINHYFQ